MMSNSSHKTELLRQGQAWHIARRWQEFDGEARSALLRVILVTIFYGIQLIHHGSIDQPTEVDRVFHRAVTLAAAAWLLISMGVFISLKGGFLPVLLKYLTTTIDFALVTVLAWLGHGTSSPLITALFLVLVLSALRFSLPLVWYATALSLGCYMILVAYSDSSWFDSNHATPVIQQAITLCSLASTGVVLGQILRASRAMSDTYHGRLERERAEVTP